MNVRISSIKIRIALQLLLSGASSYSCSDAPLSQETENTHSPSETDIENVPLPLCDGTFEHSATLSSAIPTVGIVEWSTTAPADSGYIEFGIDTSYGYVAPVNINAPELRTLLLGMKPSTLYHYRFVLVSDNQKCGSADNTIRSGALATGLPTLTTKRLEPASISDDFIVTSSDRYAIVLDKDGDIVWWLNFADKGADAISRVHISNDGQYLWAGNLNISARDGLLFRVNMDGLGEPETLHINRHHDFCVLPDNGIAYIEYDIDEEGKCDKIVERSEDGKTETIYRIREDFNALAPTVGLSDSWNSTEWCHSNAIHYVPEEDAYYVSVLHQNMILKIDRSRRKLVWALDGDGHKVSNVRYLDGPYWQRQHGHHSFENGRLLFFNNGEAGFDNPDGSAVLELAIDEKQGTASKIWEYNAGFLSTTLGDVQQLSNANFLIVYSNNGLIQEIAPKGAFGGTLVRTLATAGFGYADARSSLYGSPDRF